MHEFENMIGKQTVRKQTKRTVKKDKKRMIFAWAPFRSVVTVDQDCSS
jgi:hypothetical protein